MSPAAPTRADVACFVGFARVRPGAEVALQSAWEAAGATRAQRDDALAHPAEAFLPIPCEAFDTLARYVETEDSDGTFTWELPLAGAVRDFFRQGGLRCHVVVVAPPSAEADGLVDRSVAALVPGVRGGRGAAPSDRRTWRGLGHLHGLPDVALVCLPDLVGLAADATSAPPAVDAPRAAAPAFVECAGPADPLASATVRRPPGVVLAGADGLARWAEAVHDAVSWIRRWRRDVTLVAALPLLQPLEPPARHLAGHLFGAGLLDDLDRADTALGSSFLQLAWPWLRGDTSDRRPGALAQPDGVLTGLLARDALARGAFASAVDQPALGVSGCEPADGVGRPADGPAGAHRWLDERVTCFALDLRGGVVLRSDVTTSPQRAWRRGGTQRLVGALLRAARQVGDAFVFEASGPSTWRDLRRAYEGVLAALATEGAFAATEAWSVRCDPSTMTQADLDAGRLIAEVDFVPRSSIDRIHVSLVAGGVAVGSP